jgi:hypothetical protein
MLLLCRRRVENLAIETFLIVIMRSTRGGQDLSQLDSSMQLTTERPNGAHASTWNRGALSPVKSNRPRRIFTAAVTNIVRTLAKEGRSSSEIAAVIGSTAASVRVTCCQMQIKLSRRGRPKSKKNSGERRLSVVVGLEEYTALTRKAAYMQKSPVDLAERLLQAIISSDLYEAVLDDDK